MSGRDTVTWYLLLCCVIIASISGWMLYHIMFGDASPADKQLIHIPIVGLGTSIAIITLSELYRRKILQPRIRQ